MKKQKPEIPYEYELQLVDWLIRYFDTLPRELKVKLADSLYMKLGSIWMDSMFKDFKPEWDKEIEDLRKSGWK